MDKNIEILILLLAILVFVILKTEVSNVDTDSSQAAVAQKADSMGDISANVLSSQNVILNRDSDIQISKDDLRECCSFTDEKGNTRYCSVLNGHDCSYCSDICR